MVNRPLSAKEAASKMGVSVSTLRKMIESGAFPNAYKTGRALNSHWRIPEEDIYRAIEALRREAKYENEVRE